MPSSVADLLPALLGDRYVVVARAVLQAARALTWSETDKLRLFQYAYALCATAEADERKGMLTDAITTLDALAGDDAGLLSLAEALILRRAADLDRYDLRDVLGRDWSPETAHSAQMATLRLRQARDPAINDRFNHRGDRGLCALLACGAGLAAVPAADLVAAAAELGPARLAGCLEFAEVAWRAARPADAAAIMRAVAGAIPDQPAWDSHRVITQLFIEAADADAAAAAAADGTGTQETAGRLTAGADGCRCRRGARDRPGPADQGPGRGPVPAHRPGSARGLTTAQARTRHRRIRSRYGVPPACQQLGCGRERTAAAVGQGHGDRWLHPDVRRPLRRGRPPAPVRRRRTGRQYRPSRRASDGRRQESQPAGRGAGGPVPRRGSAGQRAPAALTAAGHVTGETIAPVLASWAALPLPVLTVRGPGRLPRPPVGREQETGHQAQPVAVALASVDGQPSPARKCCGRAWCMSSAWRSARVRGRIGRTGWKRS